MSNVELTPEPGGSAVLHGYLATPTGEGPWPGVLVIHEVFGLDEQTRRHTRRLADAGYLALAVDLYSAGGARKCLVSTMRAVLSGNGRAFADIEAGRKWLAAAPDCTGKIGIVGFCMGGGFALLSTHSVDAVSANYGMLPKDLDAAMTDACPVIGLYGGRDRQLKGAAAKLDAALTRAGVAHDVHEYPSAGHSFLNDEASGPGWLRPLLRATNIGPEPVAAQDGWRRIETFFGEHLSS
jgi:carboxymethylenebutenolidase